jgi:serine/threonine protein kinase
MNDLDLEGEDDQDVGDDDFAAKQKSFDNAAKKSERRVT